MDPAAIAIHKPATLGLGTESRCRPTRPTRITKEKKFIFFRLAGLPLFALFTAFLAFFRLSVAASTTEKAYLRQPSATR